MNQNSPPLSNDEYSTNRVEILIDESWINRLLGTLDANLPVGDKIHLVNPKINLDSGVLNLQVDILENEGSSIEITSRPVWNPAQQYLYIEDFKFQINSKNLLLKSKGWFAQLFLNAKLDKKIEERANLLLFNQLQKLKKEPVKFPISKGGHADVSVSNITVQELIFLNKSIILKATIVGIWKVELSVSE